MRSRGYVGKQANQIENYYYMHYFYSIASCDPVQLCAVAAIKLTEESQTA